MMVIVVSVERVVRVVRVSRVSRVLRVLRVVRVVPVVRVVVRVVMRVVVYSTKSQFYMKSPAASLLLQGGDLFIEWDNSISHRVRHHL